MRCAIVEMEPRVGAFAAGAAPVGTVWTLTYFHPGCYGATLTNDRGYSESTRRICIE